MPKDIQPTIQQKIVSLHNTVLSHLNNAMECAVELGGLLVEQKEALPHGKFGTWIADNLPFSDRTARNYMRVYRNRDALKRKSVSDLTEGYKLLVEPKPEKTVSPVDKTKAYVIIDPSNQEGYWYITICYLGDTPCIEGTRKPIKQDMTIPWFESIKEQIPSYISGAEIIETDEPIDYNRWLYDSNEDYLEDLLHGSEESSKRNICNRCNGNSDLCDR